MVTAKPSQSVLRRSFLFLPGSDERKLAKASGLGADAVILDLEDAVAVSRKADARERVCAFLQAPRGSATEWLVRVNSVATPFFEADLQATVRARPDALLIPKVDSPAVLTRLDAQLADLEAVAGLAVGSVKLFAQLESAQGILNAPAIAAATPRLLGLMLGHVDLCVDFGIPAGRADERVVQHARCQLLFAARAAGLDAVDTISLDFRDLAILREETAQAAAMGFTGKLAIHPVQLPVIHEAFTPSAERVQRAERVLDAWREAEAKGLGVCALDGELVERPVVEAERRVLERARRAQRA
jgi:citrate lyase beta subunit